MKSNGYEAKKLRALRKSLNKKEKSNLKKSRNKSIYTCDEYCELCHSKDRVRRFPLNMSVGAVFLCVKCWLKAWMIVSHYE